MIELFPNLFKVLPSKITDSKYPSFFVKHPSGNLLSPCFSSVSTIDSSFDQIDALGGLKYQLLGDAHFKTPHCDELFARFGAPLFCSEPEAHDVTRNVKNVVTFPFIRHELAPGIEVIPTPGHRPGGVCYRVTLDGRRYLFAGDAIWHDGTGWKAFPTKAGHKEMIRSLQMLKELEFDVLFANTKLSNPICFVELDSSTRHSFLDEIIRQL